MKKLFGLLLVLAVVAAWSVPQAVQAADYKPEYKLSTVVAKPMPWGIAGERWAELVKEKTNGRINIKCYPGTSLVGGDQTKEYTAIRQGAIDMAIGSTINWSPQVKELNIFSMPFLMPDYKAIDALTGGDVGKEIFKILESKDTVPLAWGENGFRELSNSKKTIRKPEDLKGLKIRVVGSPLFLETFTRPGRQPHPDELGRRSAGAFQRRGGRSGKPAHHLHCGQAALCGQSEVPDHLGLRGRSVDFRRQQGRLEELDA